MTNEMTQQEYTFFYENAPSSVFQGEGTSLAIIGKSAVDFDISEKTYDKNLGLIKAMQEKKFIDFNEPTDYWTEDPESKTATIDILPEGQKALKEADEKFGKQWRKQINARMKV